MRRPPWAACDRVELTSTMKSTTSVLKASVGAVSETPRSTADCSPTCTLAVLLLARRSSSADTLAPTV